MPILLLSVLVDFVVGRAMVRADAPQVKKGLLLVSLLTNLGVLAWFKYAGLLSSTIRTVPGLEGLPLVEAALPVGISFYTFQSMSYTIDLYRGRVRVARSFTTFGAFVTLFPQLIAGPIVRWGQLQEQLEDREHSLDKFAAGSWLFILGLAKKLLIADTLAEVSKATFHHPQPGFAAAWVAILLYSGQIYFDFSGYSDMAIGLGRMLGFEFPQNFDSPYQATSFSDFWRRWHMTLSTWLRDNLYIPLGGNRRGPGRTYLNLAATMLLGGLWHGASWNYVLWGACHGTYLAVERALGDRNPIAALPRPARIAFTFVAVSAAWVFFRIENFSRSVLWLESMFLGAGGFGQVNPDAALALLLLLGLIWIPKNTNRWKPDVGLRQGVAAATLLVVSLLIGYGRGNSPFLYFRF